jgi:hypothetical protein
LAKYEERLLEINMRGLERQGGIYRMNIKECKGIFEAAVLTSASCCNLQPLDFAG